MGTAGKLHTQGIEPCTIPRYVDTSPALYSFRENSEATTVWVCGNWQMRHYAVFQQRGKHGCSTTVACALGQEDLQVAADGTAAHGTLVLPALHNLDGANSAHCHMAAWIQARLHGGLHTDHTYVGLLGRDRLLLATATIHHCVDLVERTFPRPLGVLVLPTTDLVVIPHVVLVWRSRISNLDLGEGGQVCDCVVIAGMYLHLEFHICRRELEVPVQQKNLAEIDTFVLVDA